jgi:two-component system OmpR family response regulator
MLPGFDGIGVVQALRKIGVKAPVLFLTALGGVGDRVRGLEAGGDDYLVKPFAFAELLARLNALAREFQLLEFLLRHANEIVTRTMLLEAVWGFHFDPRTNIVETHISRLRAKLGVTGRSDLIHTVRGAGYVLRAQADEPP